ncbi:uncharacterized protein LOC144260110 [Eretmochelys imbricata]
MTKCDLGAQKRKGFCIPPITTVSNIIPIFKTRNKEDPGTSQPNFDASKVPDNSRIRKLEKCGLNGITISLPCLRLVSFHSTSSNYGLGYTCELQRNKGAPFLQRAR